MKPTTNPDPRPEDSHKAIPASTATIAVQISGAARKRAAGISRTTFPSRLRRRAFGHAQNRGRRILLAAKTATKYPTTAPRKNIVTIQGVTRFESSDGTA